MNSTATIDTAATIRADFPQLVRTYCAFRLGDNLAHLHFLRAMAKAYPQIHFQHAALRHYLPQMIEVVADLPNLSLRDIMACKGEPGINAWKNAGGYWENHARKNEYAEFMLEWFRVLAGRMGLESPLKTPRDLLFDYPALKERADAGLTLHPQAIRFEPFDFLVVNSVPMSGQWRGADWADLNTLTQSLAQKHDTICTRTCGIDVPGTDRIPGFTVSDIGALSCYARKGIVMVSTGPSWPTLNVWTADLFRVVLIDNEQLGMTNNTHHCRTARDAMRVLKSAGFL